jgi:hypothetical protein
METLHEMIEAPQSSSEQQRRALRNAMARRRLEQMREEKSLHRFVTEVWDEPEASYHHGVS